MTNLYQLYNISANYKSEELGNFKEFLESKYVSEFKPEELEFINFINSTELSNNINKQLLISKFMNCNFNIIQNSKITNIELILIYGYILILLELLNFFQKYFINIIKNINLKDNKKIIDEIYFKYYQIQNWCIKNRDIRNKDILNNNDFNKLNIKLLEVLSYFNFFINLNNNLFELMEKLKFKTIDIYKLNNINIDYKDNKYKVFLYLISKLNKTIKIIIDNLKFKNFNIYIIKNLYTKIKSNTSNINLYIQYILKFN